ncbi:GNAT family N-acetyltransferase [Salmonirosea aquatica]|uniref:GNAT family N-acetyltransferase n=1 Tax=Salmonirosea aquatica TaxID=2654236 RepID=A0A7C9BGS4_9BACT|nr:GNAT family N-acetyltransferase [Cytophagaceae bacterium SJW1-29]
MSDIILRQADERDAAALLDIINYEIRNSTVVYDYTERTLDYQLDWLRKKRTDGMPVFVAEQEKEVLGFSTFGVFRPWDAYQFSIEHSIYIAAKARGKGMGKLLMNEMIKTAKDMGFHTMIAGVDSGNEKSYAFHKQFGFVEVGRFSQIGYKFDRWLDLIFMQLFLDTI